MTISVIVPCYNEEESLPLFYAEMEKIKPRLRDNIEYIFVNDGSQDRTLEVFLGTLGKRRLYMLVFSMQEESL